MINTTQMTVRVSPDTKQKIKEISAATYRKPGNLIAFLVDEAWDKLQTERVSITEAGKKALEDCKEG